MRKKCDECNSDLIGKHKRDVLTLFVLRLGPFSVTTTHRRIICDMFITIMSAFYVLSTYFVRAYGEQRFSINI